MQNVGLMLTIRVPTCYIDVTPLLQQWHEFLTFASIMVLDALILVFLAIRYKYVDYTSSGEEMTDEQRKKEALQIHRRASVASLDH